MQITKVLKSRDSKYKFNPISNNHGRGKTTAIAVRRVPVCSRCRIPIMKNSDKRLWDRVCPVCKEKITKTMSVWLPVFGPQKI